MNAININYSITLIYIFIFAANCTIPDYIHICQKNDPEVSNCIINSIKTLIPYLKDGIKELDVPPLEPLQVNAIQFNLGSSGTKIGTNVSNINVWGASKFQILHLRADIPTNTHFFRVTIPKLFVEARYQIDTNILFLNIRGDGPLTINITDFNFNCTMHGNLIEQNGAEYLEFEKLKCKMALAEVKIQLDNLFNGNPLLGNATNGIINDNLDVFFEEIKPSLTDTLCEYFTGVANKITLRFTYSELFP